VTTIELSAEDAENIEFWRALEPKLGIESGRPAPKFDMADVQAAMRDLRIEGYVNLPGIVPKAAYVPLRECIARFHERNVPLPFAT